MIRRKLVTLHCNFVQIVKSKRGVGERNLRLFLLHLTLKQLHHTKGIAFCLGLIAKQISKIVLRQP